MKRIIFLILMIIQMSILTSCNYINDSVGELELEELSYDEIKDKLIRFHVIANSDTEEDQNLKLKVRDKVIEALSSKLSETKNVDEARNVLKENIDFINLVAKEVILDNNYSYDVNTMLSNENFPDKVYGNYIFPQGNYEAFRVIIGNGEGQNWWCVMFPPLCFVDETKDTVDSNELDKNIEEITEKNKKDKSKEQITFKFKIVELIKDLF